MPLMCLVWLRDCECESASNNTLVFGLANKNVKKLKEAEWRKQNNTNA